MRFFIFVLISVFVHSTLVFIPEGKNRYEDRAAIAVRKGRSVLRMSIVNVPLPEKKKEEKEIIKEMIEKEVSDLPVEKTDKKDPALSASASGDEGVISQAAMTGNSIPSYPYFSRRRGEEGIVVIFVTISTQGRCSDAEIVSSSGYSRLDNAALKWAKEADYQPALEEDGTAVESPLRLRVPFELRRKAVKSGQ